MAPKATANNEPGVELTHDQAEYLAIVLTMVESFKVNFHSVAAITNQTQGKNA
jgi:hypothetical protein